MLTRSCPSLPTRPHASAGTLVDMVVLIAISEIGFWLLLAAGLAARTVDLSRGAEAATVHGAVMVFLISSVAA